MKYIGVLMLLFSLACSTQNSDFLIPTLKARSEEHATALLKGTLERSADCLTVNGYKIIWPVNYRAIAVNDKIVVLNDNNVEVASTGNYIEIGGGETKNFEDLTDFKFHNIGANEPVWITGEIMSRNK